jgi:putative peptidoglycan lipid II flippase
MVGLFILAGPLVVTLFDYHSFTAHDVWMSQYALMAYSLGFMGFSLVKVLVTGFFSREDSRTPVRCGVISMCSAMAMNLAFVAFSLWMGWAAPHAGLALAGSLGAFVNAGLLFRHLVASGVYRPGPDWPAMLMRVVAGCLVMAAVLYLGSADTMVWVARAAELRVAWLLAWIGAGMAIYFVVIGLLGVRPSQFRLGHEPSREHG